MKNKPRIYKERKRMNKKEIKERINKEEASFLLVVHMQIT